MQARCAAFGGRLDTASGAAGRGARVTAYFAWDALLGTPAAARFASLS